VPGKTLFVAARAGNKDIFLRILWGGAKITEVESDGTTVLQAAAEENQLDVVLSLLFFGADPNLGGGQMSSPILAATDRQHVQVVAALLEAGADPSVVHAEAYPWMKSALHRALYHQNSVILPMLLRARAANPKRVPGLLQYACEAGTLNSVEQLLDAGLDINDFSNSTTALRVAVERSHTSIVKFLLERNADPNITFPDAYTWPRSPLSAAIHKQNPEILSILLSAGADPKRVPGLLLFSCEAGTLDSVKQLLDADLDINDFSNLTTALQVAVECNHTTHVKFLLERNADPNITFPDAYPWQRSPLSAAIYKQNSEILSMLLGAGADPEGIPGLLHYAVENNDLQCVKIMLEEGNADVDSVNDHLGTALQIAAAKGQRDVLIYLLDSGADPNIEGGRYRSALNAAITNGHEDCVIELLG
jgi:ankyrin repeat protein